MMKRPSTRRDATRALVRLGGPRVLLLLAVGIAAIAVAGGLALPALAAGIVAVALGAGLRLLRDRPPDIEPGVVVTVTDQPRLVPLLGSVCKGSGAGTPDTVQLTDGVELSYDLTTRWWGLWARKRTLSIGLALVSMLTVAELKAVVAAEVGRSGRHAGRVGSMLYRARRCAQRISRETEGTGASRLAQAWLQPLIRRSEGPAALAVFAADAAAARTHGRSVLQGALERMSVGTDAYEIFLREYVMPLWAAGRYPVDLFDGLREFGSAPARLDLFDYIRTTSRPPATVAVLPTLPERIARLDQAGEERIGADEPVEGADMATDLLDGRPDLERRVSERMATTVLGEVATPVTWDDYGPVIERIELVRASRLARAAASVHRTDRQGGGLRSIVAGVSGGRTAALADAVTPEVLNVAEPDRPAVEVEVVRSFLRASVGSALVDHAGCRWELDWEGPARLVGPDGGEVDVDGWIEDVFRREHGGAALLDWLRGVGVPVPT